MKTRYIGSFLVFLLAYAHSSCAQGNNYLKEAFHKFQIDTTHVLWLKDDCIRSTAKPMQDEKFSFLLGVYLSDSLMLDMDSSYLEKKACYGRAVTNVSAIKAGKARYIPANANHLAILSCAGALKILRANARPKLIFIFHKKMVGMFRKSYNAVLEEIKGTDTEVWWLCLDYNADSKS